MNTNYCGSSMCKNGCLSMLKFDEPCAHHPIKKSRIVEAVVNGINLWRVYVNRELVATFPSYLEAQKYLIDSDQNGNKLEIL